MPPVNEETDARDKMICHDDRASLPATESRGSTIPRYAPPNDTVDESVHLPLSSRPRDSRTAICRYIFFSFSFLRTFFLGAQRALLLRGDAEGMDSKRLRWNATEERSRRNFDRDSPGGIQLNGERPSRERYLPRGSRCPPPPPPGKVPRARRDPLVDFERLDG